MTTNSEIFARPWDERNPGLIIFLLDQSASMAEEVAGRAKSSVAADAVNRTIESLIERSRRGSTILNKASVGVIGYGIETRYELSGTIIELNETFARLETRGTEVRINDEMKILPVQHKIWIEPRHENGTPMAEALIMASETIREWVDLYPEAPPPVVLNVTDGAPNDLRSSALGSETRAAAESVRTLNLGMEKCLLLCVHIAEEAAAKNLFPVSNTEILGRYQELLFDISSILPPALLGLAQRKGLSVRPESRLLAINASPADLLRVLDFGSAMSVPPANAA